MEFIITAFNIFFLVLTVSYFLLILIYSFSWASIKNYFHSPNENKTFISIVVAARNEEKNIAACLNHLIKQNYNPDLFEIIIANDFSEDATRLVVETFIQENKNENIKLINLSEILNGNKSSKKNAITEAIKQSKGELIITTDADCTMKTNWLKTIGGYYEKFQPDMICGPVVFEEGSALPRRGSRRGLLFDKIQSLEFMSLIGSGGAAIQTGYPLMCNAANLAFKKEIYFEMKRDEVKTEPLSGDDTFLMFAINQKYKGKIAFLKSRDAIVTTLPQPSLKDFFNQRTRWTSKVKSYSDKYVQWIGLIIFLFNLAILFSGFTLFFTKLFFEVFMVAISAKIFIDFIFMFQISGFFQKRKLMLLFFPVQLLHLLYIIIISLKAFSGSYEWKKRTIRA